MNTATFAPADDFAPDIRFRLPDRSALADPRTLDQILPQGHVARLLWEFACALDLSELLASYKARAHRPGKPPVDVRVLITLWLFATHEGIGSARRLAALCRRDDAYRWIAGGIAVGYHCLSDFRVRHGGWLRRRLIGSVASLHGDGLVRLDHVGQDGLRVRASAGGDSMKRADTLAEHLAQAERKLQALEAQDKAGAALRGQGRRTRKEAARLRGARERCGRLRHALREIGPAAQARERRKAGDGAKTRLSATDPEARRMKMADGGFRPAYNVQMATDLEALVVVGAEATNAGNDSGLAAAMQGQIKEDYRVQLRAYYADGGYATAEDIEASAGQGIVLYTPIKSEEKRKAKGQDPYARRKGESDDVAAWRARMGTPEGKERYKRRGVAEWSNAGARRSGLYQLTVRGLGKVGVVVLWFALLTALLRGAALRGARAAPAEGAPAGGPAGVPGGGEGRAEPAAVASG